VDLLNQESGASVVRPVIESRTFSSKLVNAVKQVLLLDCLAPSSVQQLLLPKQEPPYSMHLGTQPWDGG